MHAFFDLFNLSHLDNPSTAAKPLKPVLGTIKLLPLPGSLRFKSVDRLDEIVERAEQEAAALASGGVHGLIIENGLDQRLEASPYTGNPSQPDNMDPAAIALVSQIVRRVQQMTHLPVGLNLLPNDPATALKIAAVSQASLVRIPLPVGVRVAQDGFLHGQLNQVLSAHKLLGFSKLPLLLMDLSNRHILPGDAMPHSGPIVSGKEVVSYDHYLRLVRYIETQCPPEVLAQAAFVVSDAEISPEAIAQLSEMVPWPIVVWNQAHKPGKNPLTPEADISAYAVASGIILESGIRKRSTGNLLPTIDMVRVETLIQKFQASKSINELESADPDFFVGENPGHTKPEF